MARKQPGNNGLTDTFQPLDLTSLLPGAPEPCPQPGKKTQKPEDSEDFEPCSVAYNDIPFCDKMIRMERCILEIGRQVRDGSRIDLKRITLELQTLMDEPPDVYQANTIRSDLSKILDAMVHSQYRLPVDDGWMQALVAFVPRDQVEIVMTLVAAKQFIQAFADFAVHWSYHGSAATGEAGSISAGIGG